MPLSTLSLETSKKIHGLVGRYETEAFHLEPVSGKSFLIDIERFIRIPQPNFAEAIRILPKVGEKKGFKWLEFKGLEDHFAEVCRLYAKAPTEEQGMKEVDAYLNTLI